MAKLGWSTGLVILRLRPDHYLDLFSVCGPEFKSLGMLPANWDSYPCYVSFQYIIICFIMLEKIHKERG